MHRVLVALLCALDAAVQAAVGLALVAAPLTVLWVFGLGSSADWAALWPATAAVWQLGNLVPLQIRLPAELIAAGVSPDAASFSLTLAPLAFALFTVVFGLRSGSRAARAGAWVTGSAAAFSAAAVISTLVAVTSSNAVASGELWQAVLCPAGLYAGAVLSGAIVAAWRDGDDGVVDSARNALERGGRPWADVVGTAARAGSIAVAAVVGLSAAALGIAVLASGSEIIALYQAGNVDGLGATIVTLGQLAYLPTLVVWALAWLAGPGFALGAGTAVSPVGTEVAVVPPVPVLGAIPEFSSAWLLLVVLLPIAAGAFAGWLARSDLLALGQARGARSFSPVPLPDAMLPRLATALGIAVLVAAATAALSAAASGSFGPGRLAGVGPAVGPVALAVGLEVLLGAAILLLAPQGGTRGHGGSSTPHGHARRAAHEADAVARAERWGRAHDHPDRWHALDETAPLARIATTGPPPPTTDPPAPGALSTDADDTAPIEPLPPKRHPGSAGTAD